jgi:hypothetical protein
MDGGTDRVRDLVQPLDWIGRRENFVLKLKGRRDLHQPTFYLLPVRLLRFAWPASLEAIQIPLGFERFEPLRKLPLTFGLD